MSVCKTGTLFSEISLLQCCKDIIIVLNKLDGINFFLSFSEQLIIVHLSGSVGVLSPEARK